MDIKLFKSKVRNYLYYKKKTNIFNQSKKEKRIIYFGIPMHPNLGDQAQKMCIRLWLKDKFSDYEVLEIPTRIVVDKRFGFLEIMKKNINNNDIFVFQSGYCTHDIEPSREDDMHRIVIENFPHNKMLMLPQTVYFQIEERKKLSSEIYSKATDMLFLARDKFSYNTAKEMFPNVRVELFPDIVTSLIGLYKFDNERRGIYLCTRRDCEKYYSDEEFYDLSKKLESKYSVTFGDTTIDEDVYWLDKHIEEKLNEVFNEYSSYELVITDRYHGTIFSLISGTPVIVLKTTDHKVSTGVDWFKNIYDSVYYAKDLNEAYHLSCKVLANSNISKNSNYFKTEFYDKLKNMFDCIDNKL